METISNIFKGAWHYTKRVAAHVKAYAMWTLDTFMGISGTIGGSAGSSISDGWKACKAQWAAGNRFKAAAGILVTWLGAIGLVAAGGVIGGLFLTLFVFLPSLLVYALASWAAGELVIFGVVFVTGLLLAKAGAWLLDTDYEGMFEYRWHGRGLSLPSFN